MSWLLALLLKDRVTGNGLMDQLQVAGGPLFFFFFFILHFPRSSSVSGMKFSLPIQKLGWCSSRAQLVQEQLNLLIQERRNTVEGNGLQE